MFWNETLKRCPLQFQCWQENRTNFPSGLSNFNECEVDEVLSPSHQTGGGSRLSTSTSPPASPGRRAPPLSAVLLTPQAPIDADRRFQAQNAHQQRLAACETQIMHAAHVRTPFTDEQKPTSRQRAPITPPSCRAAAAASARISTT